MARKENSIFRSLPRPAILVTGICTLLPALGCEVDDPCTGAFKERNGWCSATIASGGTTGGQPSTAAGAAGASGTAGAGASAGGPADLFGQPCTDTETSSDCGGDSPVCAPAPLGYCTNINCAAGEENAGICPDGWLCYPASAGNPSACVNL